MKTERYLITFMAVFIVLSLVYLFLKNEGGDTGLTTKVLAEDNQKQSRTLSFDTRTTGSMESGDILVELSPRFSDDSTLVVNFRINSHSVSLSQYDLKEITTLEYGGKVLKPVKASRIGGHHSSGTIVFDTGKNISNFTIRIEGIPRVEERVYEWNAG